MRTVSSRIIDRGNGVRVPFIDGGVPLGCASGWKPTAATREVSAVGRAGTPDEVGALGALLMGPDGTFITGSDFLMDGGVTAAYWYGELAPK